MRRGALGGLAQITLMRIGFSFESLRRTTTFEYAIRFLFGGLITAMAGVVAKFWGAELAGLLLAFPAIFPASATLIEKHQVQRKHACGQHGARRGREAASLDAAGAVLGSIGLVVFGLIIWQLLPLCSPALVLIGSAIAWFAVSFALWRIRKAL
jgi:hypothetical protein